jgi:hypothetical protein
MAEMIVIEVDCDPALGQLGVPMPRRMEWFRVLGRINP